MAGAVGATFWPDVRWCLSLVAYSQFISAFCSSPAEDLSSVLRCHSCAESVGVHPFSSMWLVCSFHSALSVIFLAVIFLAMIFLAMIFWKSVALFLCCV
jgi:hypothetical protein